MPLGLEPRQVVALSVAMVLLILGYTRIRKILQPLETAEPLGPPPPVPSPEVDQET